MHGAPFQPAPAAGMAGGRNHFALAVAGGAGGYLDHRSEEGLAHLAHFTSPFAGLAAYRGSPRLRAGAAAGGADLIPGKLNIFFDPKNGFFKGKRNRLAEIRAAPRCIPRAP